MIGEKRLKAMTKLERDLLEVMLKTGAKMRKEDIKVVLMGLSYDVVRFNKNRLEKKLGKLKKKSS